MELPVKSKGKYTVKRTICISEKMERILKSMDDSPGLDTPQFIRNAINNEIEKFKLDEMDSENGH